MAGILERLALDAGPYHAFVSLLDGLFELGVPQKGLHRGSIGDLWGYIGVK